MSGADVELALMLGLGAIVTSPAPLLIALVIAVAMLVVLVLVMRPVARLVRRAYRRWRYVTVPILLDLRRPAPGARGRHR